MEVEFGGALPVRFLKPENVTAYDSEGKEITIPKCKSCDAYMGQIIGLTHYAWICHNCGHTCEPKKL
jgi:hypothetical protein